MKEVIFFIFLLPIKLITCTIILVWFICFGIFYHLDMLNESYDNWYTNNLGKLVSILKTQ